MKFIHMIAPIRRLVNRLGEAILEQFQLKQNEVSCETSSEPGGAVFATFYTLSDLILLCALALAYSPQVLIIEDYGTNSA